PAGAGEARSGRRRNNSSNAVSSSAINACIIVVIATTSAPSRSESHPCDSSDPSPAGCALPPMSPPESPFTPLATTAPRDVPPPTGRVGIGPGRRPPDASCEPPGFGAQADDELLQRFPRDSTASI